MLGLTGCASAISLTENEENMIAEYMAKGLLDSQEEYTQALLEPTPTPEPTPEPTQPPKELATPTPVTSEPTPGGEPSTSTNQQANADFAQVMGMTNIKVEYTKYETVANLSESSYALEAAKGKELLVVYFDVTNTSKKALQFSLGDLDISYLLDLNMELKLKPLITSKNNDLRYIDLSIKKNETIETLLVFEVDKSVKIKDANLIISREDKTAIIKLK
jgi:hypothetical protein